MVRSKNRRKNGEKVKVKEIWVGKADKEEERRKKGRGVKNVDGVDGGDSKERKGRGIGDWGRMQRRGARRGEAAVKGEMAKPQKERLMCKHRVLG